MAGRRSGRGAYWFGALVGLVASGGGAAYLSLTTPMPESAPPVKEELAAPQVAAVEEKPAPVEAPKPAAEPAPVVEETPAAQTAETPPAAPEVETPAPAIAEAPADYFETNAAPYAGASSKPLLSIVLTGAGEGREADLAGVLELDKRVAIVIAPGAPNKAGLAARLKTAGFEALAGWRTEGGGLADSGPVIGAAVLNATTEEEARKIGESLAAQGAALVDLSQLNGGAPYRLSSAMDLPAAAAESRIDDAPSSDLVYQALERAAAEAARKGALVVMGEANPAVLSGVQRWISVKAGEAVDVAPVSAVIRKLGE